MHKSRVTSRLQCHAQRYHQRVEQIAEVLVEAFGRPDLGNKRNPLNELLYIILSSRTPPDHYQETYRALRREFTTASSLAEANVDYIAQAIELGGLQNKKAHAITAIASELKQRFGRVTLAPLEGMETEEAERFLTSLPGVSTKTARCVLMYALDRPVFPVDRHCRRIAYRLGWISTEDDRRKSQADHLQEGIPPALRKDLHVSMVVLGRTHCFPRDPACAQCPIVEFCPRGRGEHPGGTWG